VGEPAETLTFDLLCPVSIVCPGGYEITCSNKRSIHFVHTTASGLLQMKECEETRNSVV
jgi:hypothetical protein